MISFFPRSVSSTCPDLCLSVRELREYLKQDAPLAPPIISCIIQLHYLSKKMKSIITTLTTSSLSLPTAPSSSSFPLSPSIMNQSDIIVGVDRVLPNQGESSNWNTKQIKWTITHHTKYCTKQHTIELQMTLISSERIVLVDGAVKLKEMCSFGFKGEFEISGLLRGQIVQDGFGFQLYINGKSWTECSRTSYHYQPPSLAENEGYCEQKEAIKLGQPRQTLPAVLTSIPTIPTIPTIPNQKEDQKNTPNPSYSQLESAKVVPLKGVKTEVSIKSMQNEALKILIQQKQQRVKQKQNKTSNS